MKYLNIVETNITTDAARRLLEAIASYADTETLDMHLTIKQRNRMTKLEKVEYLEEKGIIE